MARVFQGMMLLSSKTRTRAKPMKKTQKIENTKASEETGGILDQSFSHDDVGRKSIQDENKLYEDKRYDN